MSKNKIKLQDDFGNPTDFGISLMSFLDDQEKVKTQAFGLDESFIKKLGNNLIDALEKPYGSCSRCDNATPIEYRCFECKTISSTREEITHTGERLIEFLARHLDLLDNHINGNLGFKDQFVNIAKEEIRRCFTEDIQDIVKKEVEKGFAQYLDRYLAVAIDHKVAQRIADLEVRLGASEHKRRELERRRR